MLTITSETLKKYDVTGPRYTSYPTAPVWSNDINEVTYRQKLKIFGQTDKTLSLYIHIPFCESLCTFCACSVIIRRQDEKYSQEYLKHLFKEIELVAQAIGPKKTIRQLHWGGGTPNYLTGEQISSLFKKITEHFNLAQDAEIALEIDPRTVSKDQLKILKQLGFNRISMGIQDFNDEVQRAVSRIQPFEQVKEYYDYCRQIGFTSINFDLIYGLPKQTVQSFKETIQKVIDLKPERIALYSFAYLPSLKKHQTKIDSQDLPSHETKLNLFLHSRTEFLKSGYNAIVMDHFALKDDELAKAFDQGQLYRNFMGYTVKPADEFIGLGITSIGFLENLFVQNKKVLAEYYELLAHGHLPTERGKLLSLDDQVRQWTIHSLMCQFHVDKNVFAQKFGIKFDQYFADEAEHVQNCVKDGLLIVTQKNLQVTELGKIFIRNICMGFDYYLKQKTIRSQFSQTV